VPVNVDEERAEQILQREWNNVQSSNESQYVDQHIRERIKHVFDGSLLTYRYILLTNILGKATNPDIHMRSMQAGENIDVHPLEAEGAYNARSLGHKVIVEWEKENGERLGGSNEPFLNKPARDPEFALENAARSQSAQERLYNLLETLEEKTNAGDIDPLNVLRQALYEFLQLEPQTVDYEDPSEVPYRELEPLVKQYISTSGGGERLAAVAAGVYRTYYSQAGDGWMIDAEHANTADEFSKSAGDVEVFREDSLVRAAEVKDKPAERSDIQHAITKAREAELGEYLFVLGSGWQSQSEKQAALDDIESAPIELIVVYPDELLSVLKFVGDAGRVEFTRVVGEYLNDMRATSNNKDEWEGIVESLQK
jgi:hypothetical protein